MIGTPAWQHTQAQHRKFWLGGAAPQTPRFLAGGAKPPQTPPLKRSFVTFDRGGQTGPPRSNDFFSARLTTRAPPTTVRDVWKKKKEDIVLMITLELRVKGNARGRNGRPAFCFTCIRELFTTLEPKRCVFVFMSFGDIFKS